MKVIALHRFILKAVKFTQTRIGKTRMRVSLSFAGQKFTYIG